MMFVRPLALLLALSGSALAQSGQIPPSTVWGNTGASKAIASPFTITGRTLKATPAGADELLLSDSAASNAFKKATVSSLLSVTSPQGRLTLQTATPVMTTTQSAKTTIYYTPYVGQIVPIWNGSRWVNTAFSELSVLTTDATKSPAAIGASKVNDWFIWSDSGTLRLSHGPDWTSDTARSAGTALLPWQGLYLNNVSITNGPGASSGTYVGTTRSNGSSQLDWIVGGSASGGTAGFLGVWNGYNRTLATAQAVDNGATYTYTTATIRQARASTGNGVSFVAGLADDAIQVSYLTRLTLGAAISAFGFVGVGLDSTSNFLAGGRGLLFTPTANAASGTVMVSVNVGPQIGFHSITANELGDGTNANTFNADTGASLSAIVRN